MPSETLPIPVSLGFTSSEDEINEQEYDDKNEDPEIISQFQDTHLVLKNQLLDCLAKHN